jgi:hypothetical protein
MEERLSAPKGGMSIASPDFYATGFFTGDFATRFVTRLANVPIKINRAAGVLLRHGSRHVQASSLELRLGRL